MRTYNHICLLFLFTYTFGFSQNIPISSTLPLFFIDTDNADIPDEPKIDVSLKVVFDPDGGLNYSNSDTYHYDGHAGIEIRGKSSQGFDKKSYGIELRKESGDDKNFALLGLPKESDWVLHGPYSDKTLMRNAIAYIIAGRLMEYSPRVRFIELILNDDYKGVYLLTEKIKRDANRVNIDNLKTDEIDGIALTGGYIFKLDKIDEGEFPGSWVSAYEPYPGSPQEVRYIVHDPKPSDIQPEQYQYIKSTVDAFENSFFVDEISNPANGYPSKIHIPSFVDYFIVNELCKNLDAYRLSTYFYKDRDDINPLIKMGPVWDFNISMGNMNYCSGPEYDGWIYPFYTHCPDDFWQVPFYWQILLKDAYFMGKIQERWTALRKTSLSNASILGVIDSLQVILNSGPVQRNFERWPILDEWIWPNSFVGGDYKSEVQFLTSWMTSRIAWMDSQINNFGDPSFNPADEFRPILFPNPIPVSEEIKVRGYWKQGLITTIIFYDLQGREMSSVENVFPSNGVEDWQVKIPGVSGIVFYEIFQDVRKISSGSIITIQK